MRRLLTAIMVCVLTSQALAQLQRTGPSGNSEPLQVGASVIQSISRGQSQRFNISLLQEEFAQLIVDQRGIDVVVRVVPPSSRRG